MTPTTAAPWRELAHPGQLPPEDNHAIFLFLAGRGAGATRSGAEWLVDRAERFPVDSYGNPTEHLAVSDSLYMSRKTAIEGPAGVISVLDRKGYQEGDDYTYRRGHNLWITFTRTGVTLHFLGAGGPHAGRGFNVASLWLDGIDSWRGDTVRLLHRSLLPALRCAPIGDQARAFVSANHVNEDAAVVQEILRRDDVAVSRGNTMMDNAANLPPGAVDEIRARFGGME